MIPEQPHDVTRTNTPVRSNDLPTTRPAAAGLTLVHEPAMPDIPGYRVEEELGRGGMGVVYRAWHLKLNRPVALKMVLGGHVDTVFTERFLAEAEAIAGLRHANVVQVHELGEHDGRPFFTMDYVPGGTLRPRVRNGPLPAGEAAAAAAAVADGAGHAHAHGVVHRDLKPANVLIDADGTLKIADFGIAKRDGSDLTQTNAIMGTPAYMAPEQAGGAVNAGPPADVWSIGVMLYEMLTGRVPFSGADELETLRLVAERDPVPPRRLVPGVPRDLQTVCLKCLSKNPAKRYADAGALAADLRRFLAGEPVTARPVGRLTKLRMWAGRNPAVAGLAVLAAALLVAGSAGMAWSWRRALAEADAARRAEAVAQEQLARAERAEGEAKRQAGRAESRLAQARETADFLEELFLSADPTGLLGYGFRPPERNTELTAVELLKRGTEQLASRLRDQPAVRARLLNLAGRVYRSRGRLKAAAPLLAEALQIRRRLGDELPLAESLADSGWLAFEAGRYGDAERHIRESIAILRRHPEAKFELSSSLILLGWTLADLRNPAAEPPLREALRIRQSLAGLDGQQLAVAKFGLAGGLLQLGQPTEAMGLIADYQRWLKTIPNGELAERAVSCFQTAAVQHNLGWHRTALGQIDKCLKLTRRFLPEPHPLYCLIVGQRAIILRDAGRLDDAIAASFDCLKAARATLGVSHPRGGEMLHAGGEMLLKAGRPDRAEGLIREVLTDAASRYGDRHVNRVVPLLIYSEFLTGRGRHGEAGRAAEEALGLLPADGVTSDARIARWLRKAGLAMWDAKRYRAAAAVYRREVAFRRHFAGEKAAAHCLCRLGQCLRLAGDPAAAEAPLVEAVAAERRIKDPIITNLTYALWELAEARVSLGRPADAAAPLEEAMKRCDEVHPKRMQKCRPRIAALLSQVSATCGRGR